MQADQLIGTEEAANTVTEWLQRTRAKSKRVAQNLTVSLYQVGFGSTKEPIQTFELEAEEEDLHPLAGDIVDQAERTALEIGPGYERISFTVMIDGEAAQKTFSLRFPVEDDDDERKDPWNGPAPVASEKSAIGMMMQHAQVLTKELVSQSADTNRMLQRENIELRRENADLRRERIKFYGLYEQMLQQDHERRLDVTKHEAEMRMKEMAAGKLMQLGVPLLNMFMGSKGGGGGISAGNGEPDTALESTLVDLVGSFDDEQLQKLALSGMLSESQLVNIMTLVQVVRNKRATANPVASTVNGVDHGSS